MWNQEKNYKFLDTEPRFLGLKGSKNGKKILHYFWWPLKKSISERIQNQLRVCKCPDKNLRYHQKWRWLWFFGSSKFEYLSWSPEKKSSASIDHTPDRTYENTLESIKTFQISRLKTDLCQFSLLSKNIRQMTVFTNYLSCLLWNAQSVSYFCCKSRLVVFEILNCIIQFRWKLWVL